MLVRIASKWLKIKLHTGAEIVPEQNRDKMLLAQMIATAVVKVGCVLGSKFHAWRRVGEDCYSCCQSVLESVFPKNFP